VITDRGRPVARLTGIDTGPLLDRLADEGRLSRAPAASRPTARGRPRVKAQGEVSALVVAEREDRR
jgi:antitoxin (DNA-binding transcriptional repressor) of toxin-antitoxin stability system